MTDTDYIEAYCKRVSFGFDALAELSEEISQAAEAMRNALTVGNKILLCGNGGSAADAQHIAAELMGRFQKDRRALPALALTTDTSILTAVAHDYDFSKIFARQIEAHGVEGDVMIAISTSGDSDNVIKASQTAKEHSVVVIGLTGHSGGGLSNHCDHIIKVPASETNHIQEMHIAVGHILCALVESSIE